jgi:hypothetical protein
VVKAEHLIMMFLDIATELLQWFAVGMVGGKGEGLTAQAGPESRR